MIEKVRTIFIINVGIYSQNTVDQILEFDEAKAICDEASQRLLAA